MTGTELREIPLLALSGFDGGVEITVVRAGFNQPPPGFRARLVFTYRVTASDGEAVGWTADGTVAVGVDDLRPQADVIRDAAGLASVDARVTLLRLPQDDSDLELRLVSLNGARATVEVWQHRAKSGPVSLSFDITMRDLESVAAQVESAVSVMHALG